MIGVEEQPDHVGWCEVVAAGEDRDDTVGVRVEGADEDVQVCRVIGDFRDGRELRRSAFAGSPLLEFGNGRRLAPHGVVVAAVYDGLLRGVCRGDDRKSTRLNSSHGYISYAVFCLKKKKKKKMKERQPSNRKKTEKTIS